MRKYRRDIERLRRTQGCLTDCVAYYFNIHPQNVPYFVYPRRGWMDRLRAYFRKRYRAVWWEQCDKPPKKGMWIVCGNSLKWKTYAHVVVYKDGKLVYDPNYPSNWKDNRITHKLVIKLI